MGLDLHVQLPGALPGWGDLTAYLISRHVPVKLRMIDGQLAFPEEMPAEEWHELRVSLPGGMITLRRETDGVGLVIWGNAEAGLRKAWHALAVAIAELGQGSIVVGGAVLTLTDFRRQAELPEGFGKG